MTKTASEPREDGWGLESDNDDDTANPPTNIVDFRELDSSIILIKGVEFPGT